MIAGRAAVLVIAATIALDRIAWAAVSQWREDQALSMWLALHLFHHFPQVGLVNSVGVPNPNGIVFAALPLTLFPNLLAASIALAFIGVLAAYATCRSTASTAAHWWSLAAVLFSAVQLRGTSVELWGQWLMVPLNLLFIATAAAYLRRPRQSLWIPLVALVLVAPSLYLAGIVNSIAYSAIWLVIVARRRFRSRSANDHENVQWPVVAVATLMIAASLAVTWVPYFRAVPWRRIAGAQTHGPGRLWMAASAMLSLPAAIRGLIRSDLAPLLQSDPRIVPGGAFVLMSVSAFALSVQAAVAAYALGTIIRRRNAVSDAQPLRVAVVAAALIGLSYPLSPLLGGFAWHAGQRLDQSVQLLGPLLVVLFAAPLAAPSARVRRTSATVAVVFAVTNLVAGWMAVASHLQYRGAVLTQADVPLLQKMAAVRWIVEDWRTRSATNDVPVAYDLQGLWWWLPEYDVLSSEWHPAQMTVGRAFDYELARRFGLRNAFEGLRPRPDGAARYVVSYAFAPRPAYVRSGAAERIFGRLRVSVQPEK
jgi:hypothetical protein